MLGARASASLGLVTLVLGACAGGGPPRASASASARASTTANDAEACTAAAAGRARVPSLVAEGRLDRARRVLEHAEAQCPRDASKGWADLAATLADLGDWEAARALAKRVDADASAPVEAKDAARAAVARADADPLPPDTDEAKAPMRAAYIRAATAAAGADHRGARDGFLEAWRLWHPNGQALIEAGRQSLLLGDAREARRLMDRGIGELERSSGKAMTFDARNGPGDKPRRAVWSPGGRVALVIGKEDVVVLPQSTMRETIRISGLGEVSHVDVSADGKLVAIASWTSSTSRDPDAPFGMISVWDARSGARVRAWTELPAPISVAFSADAKEIVAAAANTSLRTWSLETGDATGVVEHATPRRAELLDADTLAVSGDDAVEISTRKGSKLATLRGRDIVVVATSSGASRVATIASDTPGVVVWETRTGKRVGHVGKSWPKWYELYVPAGFALSPDGSTIVVGVEAHGANDTYEVKQLDVATSEERWSMSRLVPSVVLTFSPDGKLVLRGHDDGWEALVTRNGALAQSDRRHSHVSDAVFASDTKLFAWDATYDSAVYSFDVDLAAGDIRGYAFQVVSHSGPSAIGDCKSLDVLTHAVGVLPDCGVVLGISRDGKVAATRRKDALTLWDVAPPAATPRATTLPAPKGRSALSSDGALLAIADGRELRVWDTSAGTSFEHRGAQASILVVAFSPSQSGETFATAGNEAAVRVWRRGTAEAVRVLPHAIADRVFARALAFSPDGQWLAAAWSDETISVWSLADGVERATLVGSSVDFSPSSGLLAAGAREGSVRLYRPGGFELVATFRAVTAQGTGYVFTPDGFVGFLGDRGADAMDLVRCRIGTVAFPFSVCRERFEVPGLGAKLLSEDTSYRSP